jgi:predicted MFS family arabinose efflux permease
MTMLCATATGFVQLALYRMGVGVGEAGCSPTAHSLISDLYDRRRRASAMAVYSAGCSAGQILIAIAGSWVAQEYGWRTAFVLAGLPGLALALLISLSLPEPPRGGADRPEPGRPETVPVSSLTSLLAKLLRAPTIRHALAGAVVATMAGFGTHQFTAPFFIRVYEVSFSQAGLAFGLTVGLASALGLLLGGFLADRVARFDLRWYAGIPALGVALSCPLYILGFSQATWVAAVALLVVPGVLHFTYLPPTIAMLHNFVRANERASASALLLLLVSALGLGLGPWLAGLAIDHYVAELGSNALGTRRGLVVTSLLYLWAAAHYGRAAMTYLRDFRPEPAANTQAD